MSDSLYEIFRSKCFALAHTLVIHSPLEAKAQNVFLEQKGFRINHNKPATWKYYLNLTGEYHDYDKALISSINPDGHPYMKIKIAGDNRPVEVDFVKGLLTGVGGDYSLAAEYRYGSDYYNELVKRYPNCESLILGILNPIDIDTALEAGNGDILYCGGYYRKRLTHVMKETYGFEKRDDVTIDAEFLIEDWEQDVIYEIQDYVRQYIKRWEIPDFVANHSYYPAAIRIGMVGGLIPTIEKIRLKNIKSYSAHSFHVREYINSYGFLGQYVDALTRDQAMYLYYNMDWLVTNKGKRKTLDALVDNLLTPANVPLVSYSLGHDNWDMKANGKLYPTVEFKKNYYNLDPRIIDTGLEARQMLLKEESIARDNGRDLEDSLKKLEDSAKWSRFNQLQTKVLESDYTELDMNVFFNLDEFQFHNWIYAVSQGTYSGSVFITHPVTGGRLQLTPKTALILLMYTFTKGYYGQTLDYFPQLIVRNIPKDGIFTRDYLEPYPTREDLLYHSASPAITQEDLDALLNYPMPVLSYTSTTDFYNLTSGYFDILEKRRAYAAAEGSIEGNAELELMVSKFYHPFILLDPLMGTTYKEWLSGIGLDLEGLDQEAYRRVSDELLNEGVGVSDTTVKSAARMHAALMNILKFFLSYTVQLASKFSKGSSRMFGYKTLRMDRTELVAGGEVNIGLGVRTILEAVQSSTVEWWFHIGSSLLEGGEYRKETQTDYPLIDLSVSSDYERVDERFYNISGFSITYPDERQPEFPDADPVEHSRMTLLSTPLVDIHTVTGLETKATFSITSFEFLNTHGLDQITADQFSVSIQLSN